MQTLAVHPELINELFELPAVVYRENAQLFELLTGRCPVEMLQPFVVPETMRPLGHVQEIFQLLPSGHRRGAAVAGDHDGATGVPEAQALLERLLA